MRKVLFLLVTVMLLLPLGMAFAAGQGEARSDGTDSEVTLEFTWWGADPSRDAKYNAIADAFEQEYPTITISRQLAGWADYWPKLITQVAGGNAPDVMGMHQTKVSDFVRRGALLEIEPYIADGTIDLSNFPAAVIDAGSLDGTKYMVAQGVTMTGILYNLDLLNELGIDPPTNDWTWDEYREMSKQASAAFAAKGRRGWGSTDLSSERTTLAFFVRQRGKELFQDDGSLGVNVQDMVAWFEYWAELREDGAIPDAATTVEYRDLGVEQSLVVEGSAAFGAIPFNQMPNYQNYIEGDVYGVLRPRIKKGGPSGAFVEGSYLAISSNSKYPQQAASFINYFVNDPEAAKIFKLEQGAMGSSEMNDVVMPILSPIQQRMIEVIQAGLAVADRRPISPSGANEVESRVLYDAADAVAFGKLSVQAAAEQFIKQATDVLSR